jgi:putative ABC transport system ATP-binding protein
MLTLKSIFKTYQTEEIETVALNDISLTIGAGEFVAIMGPSGCGKSTLLNVLGLLDSPTSGAYEFFGEDVADYAEKRLTQLRRDKIGFVFQSFNLIDDLTVAENVEVALIYRGVAAAERRRRIVEALEQVGVAHRAGHRPQQLSGGQQQRVAVARALVSRPKLILADEPTGNLDTANGEAVMGLLTEAAGSGVTVVMVTHSPAHAAAAQRIIRLLDGRVVSESQMAV